MNNFEQLSEQVLDWACDRGLLVFTEEQVRAQLKKMQEEVDEFRQAIDEYYALTSAELTTTEYLEERRKAANNVALELGDVLVTLIITSACFGVVPTSSLNGAYNKIKHRKGRLINGIFVKEADLPKE